MYVHYEPDDIQSVIFQTQGCSPPGAAKVFHIEDQHTVQMKPDEDLIAILRGFHCNSPGCRRLVIIHDTVNFAVSDVSKDQWSM